MICVCKYGRKEQIKPIQNLTKQDVYNECYKMQFKLKEYKDIEDELGIDLITLFKVLENGIYCKDSGYTKNERLYITNEAIYHYGADKFYDFKDYGKTWALTKEELL